MAKLSYINTTPHRITVYAADRTTILLTLDPDPENQVRCKETRVETFPAYLGWEAAVPVFMVRYGELEGLREARQGVVYVASMLAAKVALKQGRLDVLSPGELLRDSKGIILGCVGLAIPE